MSLTVKAGRPPTAVDYIASELRTEIATGLLEGGEVLPLGPLAERFGTSVIPVREALRVLATEGLVVLRAHRSAIVADLPLGDLDDLYDARLLLEPEVLRRLDGKITASDERQVSLLIQQMETALDAGEFARGFEIHREVHFSLYRRCESRVLLDIIERLWVDSERYRLASMPVREDASDVAAEHWEFIEPLFAGRMDDAIEGLKAHLSRTRESLHRARPPEDDLA
jgi:DNA-binding GntR family transcriptional regulator